MDKVKDLQGNPCSGSIFTTKSAISTATTSATSKAVFYRLSSGRCGEHTITDLDTCTRAGKVLSLDHSDAVEADRVAGCYYDNSFGYVYFNSDSNGEDCTSTDNCICYGRVNPQ